MAFGMFLRGISEYSGQFAVSRKPPCNIFWVYLRYCLCAWGQQLNDLSGWKHSGMPQNVAADLLHWLTQAFHIDGEIVLVGHIPAERVVHERLVSVVRNIRQFEAITECPTQVVRRKCNV